MAMRMEMEMGELRGRFKERKVEKNETSDSGEQGAEEAEE